MLPKLSLRWQHQSVALDKKAPSLTGKERERVSVLLSHPRARPVYFFLRSNGESDRKFRWKMQHVHHACAKASQNKINLGLIL